MQLMSHTYAGALMRARAYALHPIGELRHSDCWLRMGAANLWSRDLGLYAQK
jgi:hypothetical protein